MSENANRLLKCLVVDDESMGRKLLENYIEKHPALILIGSCRNGTEATVFLRGEDVDLMFLDIQMPGLLGTQFLKTLINRPLTIFVSAYPQYAAEGFELSVVDYLVKPVGFERFSLAVTKAINHFDYLQANQKTSNNFSGSFFVYSEYALVKIQKEDVIYIEGMKDYVKIYLDNDQKRVITKASMKSMDEKLEPDTFFRIHKSYIINLNKIQSIRNANVCLGGIELPISKARLSELIKKINI